MRFSILGPLSVVDGTRQVDVGHGHRRAVLVLLLLHRNEVVLADRIIEDVWGADPPATAGKALQVCISQLRRGFRDAGLDPGLIRTAAGGYAIDVAEDELDVAEVGRALPAVRRAVAEGDAAEAVERARAALALWHGPPLADVAFEDFAQQWIARLEEQRLALLEAKADGLLALGELDEAVEDLEALVEAHPLRERFREQLMVALYRSGRQAEALEHFAQLRALLVEELGLEPSPELSALHTRMLRHDAGLGRNGHKSFTAWTSSSPAPGAAPSAVAASAAAVPAERPPRRSRRIGPAQIIVVASSLLTGAGILAILQRTDTNPAPGAGLSHNVVVALDGRGEREQVVIPVGGRPLDLAAADRRLWVLTAAPAALVEVATQKREATRVLPLGGSPRAMAATHGVVWIADRAPGTLTRVTLAGRRRVLRYRAPATAPRLRPSLAVEPAGAVWVSDGSPRLVRVNGAGRRYTVLHLHTPIDDVAVVGDALWAVSAASATAMRIDPRRGRILARVPIAGDPKARAPLPARLAASPSGIWVLSGRPAVITRIVGSPPRVADTVRLGQDRGPTDLAAGSSGVWITNRDASLTSYAAATGRVRSRHLPQRARGITLAGDELWVTAQ